MSKKSKSKRFTAQGADVVKKHDERFPYHERLIDTDATKNNL
ncbi:MULTISPECIES: competence protein [Paraliobacillus]|nr:MULTISPECIES: competence protein [Paraliobacillus]